jgi:hypothetical protein
MEAVVRVAAKAVGAKEEATAVGVMEVVTSAVAMGVEGVRAGAAMVAAARVGAVRAAVAWAVARVETYSGRHSRSSPCPSRTAPARRTCL